MSNKLQKMQAQRSRYNLSSSTETYGKIVQGIANLVSLREWDSATYNALCNLVYQYGCERMQYGFWDGAITTEIGMIPYTLERVEAEQYAEAAAAAGQQDLLDGPDPDDDHTTYYIAPGSKDRVPLS